MGLDRIPLKEKRRNKIYTAFSDEELELIDEQMKVRGFANRSEFFRTCVMTVVRGELYVRYE